MQSSVPLNRRSHFAVSYFGANVLPDNGMESVDVEGGDRYLAIGVEFVSNAVARWVKECELRR